MPLTLLADMAGAQTAVSHALAVLAERGPHGTGVLSYVPMAERGGILYSAACASG